MGYVLSEGLKVVLVIGIKLLLNLTDRLDMHLVVYADHSLSHMVTRQSQSFNLPALLAQFVLLLDLQHKVEFLTDVRPSHGGLSLVEE